MTNEPFDIEASSDNEMDETAWHISVQALRWRQMSRRGTPTGEMAADNLTEGLGANRLPQIKDDLKLIDD